MNPYAAQATLSLAQATVSLAKALQDDADALFRPPAEAQPSRTEAVIPSVLFTKTTRRYLLRVEFGSKDKGGPKEAKDHWRQVCP
jgi:hypothetical protein